MNAEQLRKRVDRRPFSPIQIALENGDRHEVRHPEFIGIAGDAVMIVGPDDLFAFFEVSEIASVRGRTRNGRRKS